MFRTFEYRPSRIKTVFPMEFVQGGRTFHGRSIDLSEGGIRSFLDGLPTVGSGGTLVLHPASGRFECTARVVSSILNDVRFKFDRIQECSASCCAIIPFHYLDVDTSGAVS
jgi:hypothetical protein